jgi:hypothetical protein
VVYISVIDVRGDQLFKAIKKHCKGESYSNPTNMICDQSLKRLNELLNECSKPHILYKKCFYVSPGPNDKSPRRMILKKETKGLKRPPPRPPMDCQVSILNIHLHCYMKLITASSKELIPAQGVIRFNSANGNDN